MYDLPTMVQLTFIPSVASQFLKNEKISKYNEFLESGKWSHLFIYIRTYRHIQINVTAITMAILLKYERVRRILIKSVFTGTS